MYKIKLLILLLISSFIISCANNKIQDSQNQYSVSYIGNEFDGLLLENLIVNHMKSLNLYDPLSEFEINLSISHSSGVFITNIDNTSDREKITSTSTFNVIDKSKECVAYRENIITSQFFIYASSDKFLSNQAAAKKIKQKNTEEIVRKIILLLKNQDFECKIKN